MIFELHDELFYMYILTSIDFLLFSRHMFIWLIFLCMEGSSEAVMNEVICTCCSYSLWDSAAAQRNGFVHVQTKRTLARCMFYKAPETIHKLPMALDSG